MTRLALYADYGCPYAHRVLALLEHLDVDYELHQSVIGEKPPGLAKYSATERIPLLVDGDLVLTESRVMLEYIAERFAWSGAYPADLAIRARHRLAVALVDEFLTPHLHRTFRSTFEAARFEEVLDVFEEALDVDGPTLFSVQIATIWLVLRRWPDNAALRAIRARPRLAGRLDVAARHDCIAATHADPVRVDADLANARARGLIDPHANPPE